MKKKSVHLIYVVAACLMASCSSTWDDQYADTPFEAVAISGLSVGSDSMEFGYDGGTQQLAITTEGYWTVASSAGWLQLSTNHGKGSTAISISASANTSTTQTRSATLTVSNGADSRTVSIMQEAVGEQLEVSVVELSFPYTGGSSDVRVTANIGWTVSSDASWLKVSKNAEGTGFSVNAQQNIGTQERHATVTVQGSGLSHTISVSQTAVMAPTISIPTVTNINKHTADCQFSFTSAELDVTEYGICYSSQTSSPDKGNAQTLGQQSSDRSGNPSFALTELTSKTIYYIRAYVVTALGTQYGEAAQFTTPSAVPNEGDNQTPND